jgi:hypothetical protein
MLLKRRVNFAFASRKLASGSMPRCRAMFAMTKRRSPNSSATRVAAISVRAVLTRRDRRSELGDLFFGLGEDWAKARPVEANFCRTFLQFYRAGESRERNRHFVEARDLTLYTASSSLFGLDALP